MSDLTKAMRSFLLYPDHYLRLGADEIDRLQARVDELEADAAQARYRMNEEKRMKALANSGGRP